MISNLWYWGIYATLFFLGRVSTALTGFNGQSIASYNFAVDRKCALNSKSSTAYIPEHKL